MQKFFQFKKIDARNRNRLVKIYSTSFCVYQFIKGEADETICVLLIK